MALQNPSVLSMVALGTFHDVPPNSLQPKLRDAIHLRWAFRPDRGFPWHGFYLYRRDSGREVGNCLARRLAALRPGPMADAVWNSGVGTLRSDRPLVLREDFPATGIPELDLGGREYLEFLPLETAHAVDVKIGFRDLERTSRPCLRFTDPRFRRISNPYRSLGFVATTFGPTGEPNTTNEIHRLSLVGETVFTLAVGERTTVTLPRPTPGVEVRLVGAERVVVAATDAAGRPVQARLVATPDITGQTYRAEGDGLQALTISTAGVGNLVSVCLDGEHSDQTTEVEVVALYGSAEVERVAVQGRPGEVVQASLNREAIDRVRIVGHDASLVDLCWASALKDAARGWRPVPNLTQPIALPVRHPDYPASGGLPTDLAASRAEVLHRVRYGPAAAWAAPFVEMHDELLATVKGGPAVPMSDPSRSVVMSATPDPGDPSRTPTQPRQSPLSLLLLASMHAPIAEMLGLYWSDETAVPGTSYDYLVVADGNGSAGHEPIKVLSEIQTNGFEAFDGFIVFGKRVEPATPLAPPTDAQAFALPGSTRRTADGGSEDASCNAGLRWHLPLAANVLIPESPVLYHLWRAAYGETSPAATAPDADYKPLTSEEPILIAENLADLTGLQRPSDWPPFPLYGLDNAVAEGWYGYRLSGVDVFGRHSALGSAARWFEWAPAPDPRPWYYVDPPADVAVHPFAVGLLDKTPPPPPTGVEAYALDPEDPYVQRDAAYNAWSASLSAAERLSVVGLRVRWNWTEAHMRQAPDTREFRIYYEGGRLNTLLGRITGVVAASATETFVQTDIVHAQPTDTFAGCFLKVGPDLFSILGSDAASPLRVRVANLGPAKDRGPADRANGEVDVPNNHSLFVNYGVAQAWEDRVFVVGYDERVTVGVDDAGRPLRRYEVFLPAAGDAFREGLPLAPDLAEPVRFAALGVTAADGRPHTADDPKWASGRYGSRPGNESSMSPPGIVFRVLRAKPAPPAPPPDSERVFATPADYHAKSYYTFRWVPQAHLATHVYRAMDDTVFTVDWARRPRAALDPNAPAFFPGASVEPRWDLLKRQEVAAELDALNVIPKTAEGKVAARKAYRGLSNDGLRVLAGLPGNEAAFAQITVTPLQPDDPATANRVGPDNPSGFAVDPGLRAFVDTLDGRSTNRYFYRACAIDGAQNRSPLGLSGPPIWLPNVVPPRSPVLVKVLAGGASPGDPGDGRITLRWASNREEDLADYRIYRAMDETAARSIRSMALVHTRPVGAGEPGDRPAENVWTDEGVPALAWTYYRMTALDTGGNESSPCDAVKARAYDEALPPVPDLTVAWVPATTNDARAEWTATTESLLERRAATALVWENATSWLPAGAHTVEDSVDERFPWKYRLRARKATGALAVGPIRNLLSR